MMLKRALISSSEKNETLTNFARCLIGIGWEIVSSGGTATFLRDQGLEITDVKMVTGYPEMLDGRVKILHPAILGGILATDTPGHNTELEANGIGRFDLVLITLYPFSQTAAQTDVTPAELIEMIDIGGPTALRSAAKNHQSAIAICDLGDCDWIADKLSAGEDIDYQSRLRLAAKVFDLSNNYEAAIRQFFAEQTGENVDSLILGPGVDLAYAENKNQNPAILFRGAGNDPLSPFNLKWDAGHPSYISIADGSRLVELVGLIAECIRRTYGDIPVWITVVGKHANPCGIGVSFNSAIESLYRALLGDPRAAMGGELVTNWYIDEDTAQHVLKPAQYEIGRPNWALDLIICPGFSDEAIEILGGSGKRQKERRLLSNPVLAQAPMPQYQYRYRQVGSAWLRQLAPKFVLSPTSIQEWVGNPLVGDSFLDLIIAFAAAWRASSNSVAIAKNGMLLAVGAGQQDRVACTQICLLRALLAGHNTHGSVFASDGFWPFAKNEKPIASEKLSEILLHMQGIIQISSGISEQDLSLNISRLGYAILAADKREGTEVLADIAGCVGGVVPADGKNLPEVKKFFEERGIPIALLHHGDRGFDGH